MKNILLLLFFSMSALATEYKVLNIIKLPWDMYCSNGINYYSIIQNTRTLKVETINCSHLGQIGIVVKL